MRCAVPDTAQGRGPLLFKQMPHQHVCDPTSPGALVNGQLQNVHLIHDGLGKQHAKHVAIGGLAGIRQRSGEAQLSLHNHKPFPGASHVTSATYRLRLAHCCVAQRRYTQRRAMASQLSYLDALEPPTTATVMQQRVYFYMIAFIDGNDASGGCVLVGCCECLPPTLSPALVGTPANAWPRLRHNSMLIAEVTLLSQTTCWHGPLHARL
jgi:hypothetical protein